MSSSEATVGAFQEFETSNGVLSTGLLDAIHEEWLQRTNGGDGRFITTELNHLIASGQSDNEPYVSLLGGHIALIAKEHIDTERDEATLYEVGKKAVMSYSETVAAGAKKMKLIDAIDAIEAAYISEMEAEPEPELAPQDIHLPPEPEPEPPEPKAHVETMTILSQPRIRKAKRQSSEQRDNSPKIPIHKMEALERANEKRSRQAKIKTSLREGKLNLSEALDEPGADTLAIAKFLRCIPSVGPIGVKKALKAANLAPETQVGALTDDEKIHLISLLPAKEHQKPRKSTSRGTQAMESLKLANELRIYRAGLKRKLTAKEMTVAELLEDEKGAGLKLFEVLTALPVTRRQRKTPRNTKSHQLAETVLQETGLPGDKRCRDLTPRQRQRLLDCLSSRDQGERYSYSIKSANTSN